MFSYLCQVIIINVNFICFSDEGFRIDDDLIISIVVFILILLLMNAREVPSRVFGAHWVVVIWKGHSRILFIRNWRFVTNFERVLFVGCDIILP